MSSFRSGRMDLYLAHSNFPDGTPMLSGPGIPTAFQFQDTDQPFEFSDNGLLFSYFLRAQGFIDLTANTGNFSYIEMNGFNNSFQVLSAVATSSDVPEPSTLGLGALAGAVVWARRRRRF